MLYGKRDVQAAFKLIWVSELECFIMALEIPGEPFGLRGSVTMLSLVLTFGWVGFPGDYQIFGTRTRMYHESFRPTKPEWNDTVPF